jgi:hypothetical protein
VKGGMVEMVRRLRTDYLIVRISFRDGGDGKKRDLKRISWNMKQ